jgi:hypothetical protein
MEPPYNLIISTLKECFDPAGEIYPRLKDRAYSSAQAILWIHVCAVCVSEGFALRFPLPDIHSLYFLSHDNDLSHLLWICIATGTPKVLGCMYDGVPHGTPAHSQWVSNTLLHLSWAKQSVPSTFSEIGYFGGKADQNTSTLPANTILNCLLVASIFLGWPLDEEVLKIQDMLYAASFSLSPTYSHCCLLVVTWNKLCHNSPKQWFQPSTLLTLNANTFQMYCVG